MTIQEPLVRVLLATHNGEKFLDQQIASIINQNHVRVEIDVLDDGSTDGSVKLLEAYLENGQIHSLTQSAGLGPSLAFQALVKTAREADYFAFADQDDIWSPNKLIKQIEVMSNEVPCLVISKRKLIDATGLEIKKGRKKSSIPSFNNAVVQNIAYGNTQVMNPLLYKLVKTQLGKTKHFDAWIYLLASAYGSVILVNDALIQYRIHDSNAVGLGKKSLQHLRSLIEDSIENCICLKIHSSELSLEKTQILDDYLSIFTEKSVIRRFKLSIFSKVNRETKFQTYVWKIAITLIGSNIKMDCVKGIA